MERCIKSHEKCKDQRKVGQRGAGKCTIEDKTTCQIPWVFRISVKSETHGFAFRRNIRYGSSK